MVCQCGCSDNEFQLKRKMLNGKQGKFGYCCIFSYDEPIRLLEASCKALRALRLIAPIPLDITVRWNTSRLPVSAPHPVSKYAAILPLNSGLSSKRFWSMIATFMPLPVMPLACRARTPSPGFFPFSIPRKVLAALQNSGFVVSKGDDVVGVVKNSMREYPQ
jgi:hypothetical protein